MLFRKPTLKQRATAAVLPNTNKLNWLITVLTAAATLAAHLRQSKSANPGS